VGQATQEALAVSLSPARSREEAMDRTVFAFRVIGSPGYELDEAELRDRAGLSYRRANDPGGVSRQLLAIFASGDKTPLLRSVHAPTLVLHAAGDPLIAVGGGRATANAIPAGATLIVLKGMGHDPSRALWPEITARIAELVQRAEAAQIPTA
jgi:pimeloyl-ACP methyl ester carboxylesterase